MRDLNIAWAAGFFDGEGSTSVLKTKRDKYSYIRMSITQKDRAVLDKFQSIVGVGKIYKHNTRNTFSWDCYKQEEVFQVLDMLWPFLSDIKRTQAENAKNKKTQTPIPTGTSNLG
jgi:hypothetical protein